tara:strand:+ start:305 stop:868 length:564 start_codon:yes stop_codon:yes gene_type:complete
MQDPLYNATAQRFNVQYAHAVKKKLEEQAADLRQCAECWHVKQRELLFTFPSEKSHQRSKGLECLSNLAGWDKGTKPMPPVFVGVAAYDVNETKHTSGFGAFRQGTVSITNTGSEVIKPGEHVWWKPPTDSEQPKAVYGVPKAKRVALTVGENGMPPKGAVGGYLGQALNGAQAGARLDLVMFVQDC